MKLSNILNFYIINAATFLACATLWGEQSVTKPDQQNAQAAPDKESVLFTPPEGWRMAAAESLPPCVKAMVVGKGAFEFPPSINLGTETYSGNLKQYLKRIKDINASQGVDWKDLGTIRTEAGDASLSQVDTKTQWGEVRMMHVILLKDGTAYILTAAALKDEFAKFYKDFFNSLRSLRFSISQNPTTY